jgi:hypothetical protein
MGKRPTESGGEPSSSNCGYSAEGQAHQLLSIKKAASHWKRLLTFISQLFYFKAIFKLACKRLAAASE